MNAVGNSLEVRREQGFEVYVLSNPEVEIAVIPQLGSRISSLRDRRTGREWMWHPEGGRKLFRNREGDDFARSPMAGADECLPTIAPCSWRGRALPDHGEVWSAAWDVNREAWGQGVLRTSTSLNVSPLNFERTVELVENEIRLSYQLSSRSPVEELFLWAMHPLLRLVPGDQLELPASTRVMFNGAAWIDTPGCAQPVGGCEKIFAGPIREGRAAIKNSETGDRLEFQWDATENNTLGIWLNCGGWHGHHHFALEPANGEPDALTVAAERRRCGRVAPHGTVAWQVVLRIGS